MIRRLIILGALLVVGLPVLAVAVLLALANTEWGQARIAAAVESATAEGPVQIRIDRLSGPLPVRIGLQGLRLSDRSGPFATFERVELAWSPLALLGGELAVDAVEVSGGEVSRAPDLPAAPETEPVPEPQALPSLAFPAPPVAVDLRRLRVSGLVLGEGLAGRAATLGADLSGRVTGESATAAGWIEASAADGTARLDLDLAVVPDDGTLRAEVRATEPEGGIVAGLLGLSDRSALDLTLSGSGTLADWTGKLAGGFGPEAAVDLFLAVAGEEAGTRVGVEGTVSATGLLPPDVQPLLGPSAGLELAVRLAADGSIALEHASVRAAAGEVRGNALIDPAGVPVAARVSVSAPDLARLSALAGTDLSGAAQADLELAEEGRRAALALTGSPMIAGTALDDLRLDLTATADQALAGLPQSVDWTLDGAVATPERPEIDLSALLGTRLTVQAAGSAKTDGAEAEVTRLAVIGDDVRLEATATLAEARRVEASGSLALADLRRLSDLAGQGLSGAADLTFDGTVLLDPLDVSAVVDLAASDLDLQDPALTGLLGASPTVGAGITLDAENRLAIHGLAVRAATLQADGDATIALSGGALDGRVDLRAPDLAAVGRALAIELDGEAQAAVALGGTLEAPTASASWQAAPLVVQGTRLESVAGTATATGLPASPAGRIRLRAAADGETVTLGADYALAGSLLEVSDLNLDGAGLQARGAASVRLDGPAVDGELIVSSTDLGRVGALAGLPLTGGSLDATVRLEARNGQSARLSGTVRGLALDDGTEIAEVELSGDGRALLSRPAGSLRVTAGGVRQGGTTVLQTATLTAESDGTRATAELSLEGEARENGAGEAEAGKPYSMTATASAALDATPMRVSIDTLQADVAEVRIALSQPTRITLGAKPRFDDLALTVDGGRITGGGRIDPQDLDLTVAVRDLPADLARLADPTLKLEGGIDADLSARGPLGAPTARMTVSVPGLRSADKTLADVPPLRARAEVRIDGDRLSASADASAGEGAELTLRATAGLVAGAGGAPPTLDADGPVEAEIDAELALDQLTPFLPLAGGRVGGQASVHVAVAGTADSPRVSGTAALRDGLVEQPRIGLYLRDVTLDMRGRGERLEIETLTASAAGGGTLEGSGGISFDVTEGAPADMRLVARRLRVADTDFAEVNIDGDLTFQGAIPEYRLAGTVTVLRSEIRIPEQLPPSVVELEVTEVRDGVVVRTPEPREPQKKEGDAPVLLDIAVSIPGQVFIRGRGLDSEWGGELAISGRLDAPEVSGGLQVRRGQLGAVGRTFRFDRGRVTFDGGVPENPALDMLLTTEVAEIVARIEVSGRAQDPEINLSSQPALPEEEVLSRILFGSSRAQLSPLQALKLAQSAAVLSGRLGGGGGITDTVRETLGVDSLDVDVGDGGESSRGASLSVGKYIAPGVFLKLQQGLSGTSSRAVVEVELTDNITVETDVGADSHSRAGVNWKLDY